MAGKVWNAEELEKMSPAEQDQIFESSIVRGLDAAPQHLVDSARAAVQQRLEADDTSST
jgi:hypothetical protein